MTPDEMAGYELFRGKGNCTSCRFCVNSMLPTCGQE
jgi:cytochrome c peroxidase